MSKLKYEDVAAVGERIRSFDFHGIMNCYIEGVIQRITDECGFRAFVVLVDKDIHRHTSIGHKAYADTPGNKSTRVGQVVFVPMEIALADYNGRIENLT